jgi:2-iminobutanoate/2-iminopropanoate deaminase
MAEPVFHPFTAIPGLPFSEAVDLGDLVFLSGQIGSGADGKLVADGVKAETKQTMANIGAVLGRLGLTMNDVIKVTVMMADMSEWSAMNEEYVKAFDKHLPARSAFGASSLAMNARVEIECIALRRKTIDD